MARPFFSTTTGSVTCPRCGNFIASDTETCMHCGADLGHARDDEGPSLASSLRLPFTARRYGALSSPYPSLAEASEVGHRRHRKDVSKAIVIGGVALVLITGGVIYYAQRGDSDADTQAATGQSVFGPIDAKLARDSAPTKPVAGTAAVLPAPTPLPTRTQPPRTAFQPVPQPTATAASRTPAPAPAAPSRDTTQASTIDNLQAARDAIERGDLVTARRRFSKIPASQLEAGNVQRTQAELIRLEHARDDSLQFARACAATESWSCARQNARDVLAIDASNAEAQALVESSIERSGWLNPPRPAPTHSAAPRTAVATAGPSQASNRTAAPPRARAAAAQPPLITRQPPLTDSAGGTRGTRGAQGARGTHAATTLAPPDVAQGVQRQPVAQQIAPVPVQATPVQAAQAIQPAQAVMPQAATAPAPVTAAVPPAATPASIQPAPSSLPATVADNPSASVHKHSSFDAANPDDRERAILENGWTKNRPPDQPPPSQ
jgi:hypothetical protein